MRSPAARLLLGAAAWIVFGAAAYFIVQSEQELNRHREAVRLFDLRAGDAAAALNLARSAQQAYLVPGQGVGLWMSRAEAALKDLSTVLDDLRQTAQADSREALADAGASVTDLHSINKRAYEYFNAAQSLMAADVVFSEGRDAAATTGRHVEAARLAEHLALDGFEKAARRLQTQSAGGATLFAAFVIAVLAFAGPPRRVAPTEGRPLDSEAVVHQPEVSFREELELDSSHLPASTPSPPSVPERPDVFTPSLKAAVGVCTELNRARDADDLTKLLGEVANIIDASGLVVWVGAPSAVSLQPVLAHGYSAQALARMPSVSRSDNNAAATAFRTGEMQIVLARPGVSSGALAAPMLSRGGCVGALTAEVRNGGEASETVQAFAAILAAQLAGILADSVSVDEGLEESRTASG